MTKATKTSRFYRTLSEAVVSGIVVAVILLTFPESPLAQSWTANGSNLVTDGSTNNVGIGTTAPSTRLHVSSPSGELRVQDNDSPGTDTNLSTFVRFTDQSNAQIGYVGDGGTGQHLDLHGETGYSLGFGTNGIANRIILDLAGKVGIGTSAPNSRLTVLESGSLVNSSGSAILSQGSFNINEATQTGGAIVAVNTQNMDKAVAQMWLTTGTLSNSQVILYGTSNDAAFQSRVGSTGATSDLLFNPSGGNVGIGTMSPTKKLDVAGDANFSGTVTGGNIQAKYQDVAEWVPSSEPLKPGMVVVLDSNQSNHVLASSRAYDTRVAGVVSDRPGLLLGESGATKEKIATTGRVKVKVDAARNPIRVGDLLVTGEKPGTAMASIPMEINGRNFHQPGTILGKALEPLPTGEGEILVLLCLQ